MSEPLGSNRRTAGLTPAAQRRQQLTELLAQSTPVALTLIMQTLRCTQCKRGFAAPAAHPMVALRATHGKSVRHIRVADYPYAIPQALPRRVIHIDSPIECCDSCFMATDIRQGELFHQPLRSTIPLPFKGQKPWEERPAKPAAQPPQPLITLEYF